jgi:glutaminyl-peptide cyclotransferase
MRVASLSAAALAAALALVSCGRPEPPAFDGGSAFAYLEEQCDIGPRFPGSPGHEAVQRYLVGRLEAFGAKVTLQPFRGVLSTGDTLALQNIVGSYRPGERTRILVGAHYDTRPWADRDPDPANRSTPIIGANDGASGVAVLLEIARILHGWKAPVGVDLVFFDGEDSGREESPQDYLLGSRRFAASLAGHRPAAVIVLDMVGEREARIPVEGFSAAASPVLCARIYGIAERLGIAEFTRASGPSIIDDHLPFIQAGLPAIDLIDFDYPSWHTLGDTPDKCSAESLAGVGTVVLRFIAQAR